MPGILAASAESTAASASSKSSAKAKETVKARAEAIFKEIDFIQSKSIYIK